MSDDYYFGVWSPNQLGHHLYLPSGHSLHRVPAGFPFGRYEVLDGSFLPISVDRPEGEATFFHINGWTVISFWDLTGDRRPGSNSTFLARGHLDFDSACKRAKEKFSGVWSRFRFDVRERRQA